MQSWLYTFHEIQHKYWASAILAIQIDWHDICLKSIEFIEQLARYLHGESIANFAIGFIPDILDFYGINTGISRPNMQNGTYEQASESLEPEPQGRAWSKRQLAAERQSSTKQNAS